MMLKQLRRLSNQVNSKKPTDLDVAKFSGLRIRNQMISSAELSNQFSDIRFVRLSTINVSNANQIKDTALSVFAFFNAGVRKDSSGPGFQFSVSNANQILKIGTSIDYGVCKGRRKDGVPCSIVVNKYVACDSNAQACFS